MASGLPQIQYPGITAGAMNAFDWGRQRRKADDDQNAFREAGGFMAQGNLKGGRDTLYRSGNIDAGLKLQGRMDAMSDRQREQAKRFTAIIGQGAMLADTPEKWSLLVQGLKARGIPGVDKYADFNMRETAIAENGQALEYLERQDRLNKEAAAAKTQAEATKYERDQAGIARTDRLEKERYDRSLQQDQTDLNYLKAEEEQALARDRLALDQKKADADANKPDYMEIDKRAFNKRTGQYAPRPDDVIDPEDELPEEVRKALATKDAATLTGYSEASTKAGEAKASLDAIKAQRAKTNWEGAGGGDFRRGVARMSPLGGDGYFFPDSGDRAAMDTMDAEAAKLTQANASALKGTTSDADLKLLAAPVPDSSMTDAAAKPIIQMQEAAIARTQAKAEMSDQYLRTHGSLRGFDEAWNRFINEKRLLSEDPATKELTFNPDNVLAWRSYVGQRPQRQRAQPQQPARQYQQLPEGGFPATMRQAPTTNTRPTPSEREGQPAQRQPQQAPAPSNRAPQDMSIEELRDVLREDW